MAIQTYTTITRGGLEIGVSKLFSELFSDGDLTAQELARFSYAAWEAPECNAYGITDINVGTQQGAAVTSQMSYFQAPLGGSGIVSKYVTGLYPAGRLYCFNVICYTNAYYENITTDVASNVRLVTDIDLTSCAMTLRSAPSSDGTVSVDYPEAQTITKYKSGADDYNHDDGKLKAWNGSSWSTMSNIRPYCIIANDSGIIFITQGSYFGDRKIDGFGNYGDNFCPINSLALPEGDHITDQKWNYSLGDIVDYTKSKHLLRWVGNEQSYESQIWASGTKKGAWSYDDNFYIIMEQTNQVYGIANDTYYIYPKSLNVVKRLIACVGLNAYIGDDKSSVIKPIIENGLVVGYSEDAATPSEIDNITNVTGNNISPFPPSPPGPTPGPYEDDPWSGATFAGTSVGGAGAFAKVYYMTSTELANLRSWMNSINVPEGFDPMQQIIGLSQVPVALSGSSSENVVFVNSSAVYDPGVTTRAVDTGVATQQAMGTPISYYLGSVNIARRMQERGEPYLDYDCQIELYLPLIGMFSLDTQAVMGRTISAYAVLDPVSGTLAAYAYVSKDGQNLPVAYGSTTIGVDLPISAQQLSVSRAALKQANAQLGASLLSGALTMMAAASSGKASGTGAKTSTGSSGLSAAGIREAGSDYMKASQVGNVFGDFMNWGRTIRQLSYGNNTAVAGSFGGSTAQWAYPFTPYVKIIRPRFEKPSNYAHSQGVPCVQTKTIGSCTGFIQCIGVDVSGISGATDLELQAIQAALSNGIYAGGGQ